MQDCAGLILSISSNELQVCTNTKINDLGVPITLPYMALQSSLYGNCCLQLINYPITVIIRQSHGKLVYISANLSNLTTFH